jgi:hypothetical protein
MFAHRGGFDTRFVPALVMIVGSPQDLSSEAVMKRFILAILIIAPAVGLTADEGMWTFDT